MSLVARLHWVIAAVVAAWALWTLETERAAIPQQRIATDAGLVSLYGPRDAPLVIVTHGFAGSARMMQAISFDLARAGFRVAAFDFAGHGRSAALMSRDVTRIEGATEQLVQQTLAVVAALDPQDPVALLGHSMATDIVIRAAARLETVAGIVVISMYSDVVRADWPERLLILSGAWETRLRTVALDNLRMVDSAAVEGETVTNGRVMRRAAVAPGVEHVGVLFSATTLRETRAWLGEALAQPVQGQARSSGPAILALLIGITVLSGALARLVPLRAEPVAPLPLRTALGALLLPVLPAIGAALLLGGSLFGIAAFGHLLVFFAVWGCIALVLLARGGHGLQWPDLRGMLVLWAMCLAFALALDRHGASFVPAGPRLPLMLVLLFGTLPFMLADRLLVAGAPLWLGIGARVLPILALFALMIGSPEKFGLLFTVLPVMVLFYLVFGTMGRIVARRTGASTAGFGLGVVLAWSIAASQPLFDAVM